MFEKFKRDKSRVLAEKCSLYVCNRVIPLCELNMFGYVVVLVGCAKAIYHG